MSQERSKRSEELDGWPDVYRELYAEMRRCRDVEFDVGRWNSAIVLAAMAALAGALQIKDFELSGEMRVGLAVAMALVTLFNGCFLLYCAWRYHELRAFANTIEPSWKVTKGLITTPPWFLTPSFFNILTQLVLAAIFIALLLTV